MWPPARCLLASFLAPSPSSQHPLSTPSSPSHTTAPHVCVQLAKALSLYVVGIAGPKNVDWVKSLGADEVSFT